MLNILNSDYKILQSHKHLLKDAAPAEWNWIDLEINVLKAIKHINHKSEKSFIFSKHIFNNIKIDPLQFLKRLSDERKKLPSTASRQRFHQSILCRILLSENKPTSLFFEIITTFVYMAKLDRFVIAFARKLKELAHVPSKN